MTELMKRSLDTVITDGWTDIQLRRFYNARLINWTKDVLSRKKWSKPIALKNFSGSPSTRSNLIPTKLMKLPKSVHYNFYCLI